MSWLARLKNSNVPPVGTDRTDKRPARPLLAVLSVGAPGSNEKHETNEPRPVVHFRLRDHAPNAWATALGRPGETIHDLTADLRERYGSNLIETKESGR